jgi:broad specificity polyphosphatase/5'/3'-nucleotidase SurE
MSDILSKELLDKVEENSAELDRTIADITDRYSGELDEYMNFIRGILRNDEQPPTDAELDDFALNLSTMIYFTSVGAEQMGIRDDISSSAYKEAYNMARNMQTSGTVADKNAQAELDAMAEKIISIVYSKSYKILKAKVEAAQEVLSSVKKIISRRMNESELSMIQINK